MTAAEVQARMADIREASARGELVRDTAKRLGVHPDTVARWRRAAGVRCYEGYAARAAQVKTAFPDADVAVPRCKVCHLAEPHDCLRGDAGERRER
jgi:hypothetical protein